MSGRLRRWREAARGLKRSAHALYLAARHPATPWYAKVLGVFVVAYALSPVDLIPDFIPVLGYLDDLILLPALIWLTMRLLPAAVVEECRAEADAWIAAGSSRPRSTLGAIAIVAIWIAVGLALVLWLVAPSS